ncbi:MAG: hypothetical protein JW969_02855 [Spirochaetales bacterium]|nr:hypothetical protein [Spirochaetales bacterium]
MKTVYPFISIKLLSVSLLILLFFNALSAIGGGIGLVVSDGLGMPKSWLTGSPFDSFLVPGIILAVIVGGTNLAAAVMEIKKLRFAPEASAVAGFGLQIWIYAEIYIIRESAWLQTVYFVTGTLILILVFLRFRVKKSEK